MEKEMSNNKLIAEFMGLGDGDKYFSPTLEDAESVGLGTHVYPDEMRYHASWDWLMPVLKKINLRLHPDTYGLWRMINVPTEYTIKEVHTQAVQFIKECNDER